MVDFVEGTGPTQVRRIDRQTGLRVTAQLDGITAEKAKELIEARMDLMELPSGYAWSFGGGFDDDQEAMQKMVFNILLAIAIIYIVLAAQFESLVYPASMVCTIVFSVIGVYWFFLLTGTTFTFMAMIGILILIGVTVNNGIVLIDHVNQLRLQGLPRDEALIQAGRDRLRPILMTVGTTVLGLTPLCIGTTQIGWSASIWVPLISAPSATEIWTVSKRFITTSPVALAATPGTPVPLKVATGGVQFTVVLSWVAMMLM